MKRLRDAAPLAGHAAAVGSPPELTAAGPRKTVETFGAVGAVKNVLCHGGVEIVSMGRGGRVASARTRR